MTTSTDHDRAGIVTVVSVFPVRETMDRLVAAVEAAGLMVFARIDHAGNAAAVGLELRPTELLIFGNPRGGTPLMQLRQTVGIDLPVKALAWQDEAGRVWLSYNDADWLAQRHGIGPAGRPTVEAIATGQAALAQHATGTKTVGER
jgi:uncharacterized protein (DUF302 family)